VGGHHRRHLDGPGREHADLSAGLEGIDGSYTEAAQVDGATLWQSFWNVTLPLLRPTLLFVTVTSFISGMGAFDLILVLTNGGPAGSTSVAAFYMYQTAFEDLRLGRASAAAFVLFVIIFMLTLIQLRFFRRGGVEAY
jgi:multiple sugar transport system permease protein